MLCITGVAEENRFVGFSIVSRLTIFLVGVALVRKSLAAGDHGGLALSHSLQRNVAADLSIQLDPTGPDVARPALLPVLVLGSLAVRSSS